MSKVSGSCNCGAVSFEVNKDDIKRVVNCHCNLCRKMNGAAFSTYVGVLDSGFKFIRGEEHISSHRISEDSSKNFCKICGTPIYNMNPNKYKAIKIIHLGALNNPTKYQPEINIFCENKIHWIDKLSQIDSFDQEFT